MSQPDIFVSDLMIYPIKSTRRVKLNSARVGSRGFEGDRRWMVVDENGVFISQRQYPSMALITVVLNNHGFLLQAPAMAVLNVSTPDEDNGQVSASVWKDKCSALDAGDKAAQWLSDYIGISCRLVYMPENSHRQVDLRYAREGDITSFADGFPFLLTTEASLEDLNQRLASPVTMTHFRPNIVLSGAKAYEEDQWQRIRIGAVTFKVAKPCRRCVITTVNPETGKMMGKDPLYTLSQYRKTEQGILFGQNLIQENQGEIKLGDRLEILE